MLHCISFVQSALFFDFALCILHGALKFTFLPPSVRSGFASGHVFLLTLFKIRLGVPSFLSHVYKLIIAGFQAKSNTDFDFFLHNIDFLQNFLDKLFMFL